jgi:hypothetical protein
MRSVSLEVRPPRNWLMTMNRKHLRHGVLIAALGMLLATPAEAQIRQIGVSGQIGPKPGPIIAAVVAVAVAVVVVTVVVIHEASKKRAITGCVSSNDNVMSLTDEKDKRIYVLSGSTTDIKAGERFTLRGKKAKSTKGNETLVWEVNGAIKNLGACQP